MKKLIAKLYIVDSSTSEEIQNITSISFGALDRGNVSDTTNWGCFSNKGEISFVDTQGIVQLLESMEDIEIEFFCKDQNSETLLATFIVDDFEQNEETKEAKITLKDKLLSMQTTEHDEIYKGVGGAGVIASSLLNSIGSFSKAGLVLVKLSYIRIPVAYIESGSVWSQLDKFCQATMLRCVCNKYGEIEITDETKGNAQQGVEPLAESPSIIRSRNILSIGNKTKNYKTKINSANIVERRLVSHVNEKLADCVGFTWFNVYLTTNGWEPVINRYNENGTTKFGEYEDGSLWAFFETVIKKPDNFFRANASFARVSIVNLETGDTVIKSTAPIGEETKYEPSKFDIYDKGENLELGIRQDNIVDESGNLYCQGEISAVGDFFTDEGTKIVGDTEAEISLNNNELIQSEATYDGKRLARHIVDTVKEKYGNGVECVEIEVTPSTYYDKAGNVIVGTEEKPVFERYDLVVPYVTRGGVEVPYSTNSDGTPKTFKVIGIDYSYSGLLRQKLYLQENV